MARVTTFEVGKSGNLMKRLKLDEIEVDSISATRVSAETVVAANTLSSPYQFTPLVFYIGVTLPSWVTDSIPLASRTPVDTNSTNGWFRILRNVGTSDVGPAGVWLLTWYEENQVIDYTEDAGWQFNTDSTPSQSMIWSSEKDSNLLVNGVRPNAPGSVYTFIDKVATSNDMHIYSNTAPKTGWCFAIPLGHRAFISLLANNNVSGTQIDITSGTYMYGTNVNVATNTTVTGTFTASGTSTLSGAVINIGTSTSASTVSLTGVMTYNGASRFLGAVTIGDEGSYNPAFIAHGAATFNGAVTFTGGLTYNSTSVTTGLTPSVLPDGRSHNGGAPFSTLAEELNAIWDFIDPSIV